MLTVTKIKYLDWDSNFFDKKVCSISIEGNISSTDLDTLKNYPADLIYVICSNPGKETIDALNNLGAELYDKKVTFSKSVIDFDPYLIQKIKFESQTLFDGYLENLAYQSGEYSRFKLDSKLSSKFNKLYKAWLEKSLDRRLADEVYLAFDADDNKVGFLTLAKNGNEGKIGLIAVDSNFRGKKHGVHLMTKAEEWYLKNDITFATVVTQLDNLPACNLYKKMGYQIIKTEYIFHLWKS